MSIRKFIIYFLKPFPVKMVAYTNHVVRHSNHLVVQQKKKYHPHAMKVVSVPRVHYNMPANVYQLKFAHVHSEVKHLHQALIYEKIAIHANVKKDYGNVRI